MREPEYPILTPQELAAAGQALYGSAWRCALAQAFAVSEGEIAQVESGCAPAPREWRAKLVALAQDTALRALDAASNLLWCESSGESVAPELVYAPPPHYV